MRRLLLLCIVAACCLVGHGTNFNGVRYLRSRHAVDGTHGTLGTHGTHGTPRSTPVPSRPLFSWDLAPAPNSTDGDTTRGGSDMTPAGRAVDGTPTTEPSTRNRRRHGGELRTPLRQRQNKKTPSKGRRHSKKVKSSRVVTSNLNTTTPRPPQQKPTGPKNKHKKDKNRRRGKKNKKNKKKKKDVKSSVVVTTESSINRTTVASKPARVRGNKREKLESIQQLLIRNNRRHESSSRRPPGSSTEATSTTQESNQVQGDVRERQRGPDPGGVDDGGSQNSNLVPDSDNKPPSIRRHSDHVIDNDNSTLHLEVTKITTPRNSSFQESLDTENKSPPIHKHPQKPSYSNSKPPPSHRVSKQPLDEEIENSIFPSSIENKVAVDETEGHPSNDTDNAVPVFSPLPEREREWVRLCSDKTRMECEHLCLDVKGKPVCVCYRGFQKKGNKCQDIDECAVNNGGCEQGCQNVLGSHHCFCHQGFRLSDNDKTCTDVNECLLRNGHGPCQDTCTNTWGGYTCTCGGLPGTRLASNNHTCDDLDECAKNNAGCSHTCLNTLGNAFCLCPPGYMLGDDWKTCHDIDECSTEDVLCLHGCVNTPGSYHCAELPECPPGFERGPEGCEDVDECQDSELCDQLCLNTNGSYTCSCKVGFQVANDKRTCKEVRLDAVCPPLDTPRNGYVVCMRLALSSGPWRHRIVNHSGSICELRCPAGYRITGLYRRFCGQSGRWLGPHYGSCDRLKTYY